MRKTKIVATIGPASHEPEQIQALIQAGTNVFRLNLSHLKESLSEIVERIHDASRKLNQPVAIIADLQGPKIRIGTFENEFVHLKPGQNFKLKCDKLKQMPGNEHSVYVDYETLCADLSAGDHVLLDDGLIELKVDETSDSEVSCTVIEGGVLQNHKGINRRGGGLNARAITTKDETDLKRSVQAGVDYIALSFVKNKNDIFKARQLLKELDACHIQIIAKIERTEALVNLSEIIEASDAIMVARGDLAVEVGPAEVPGIQKEIIYQTQQLNKTVITATQMMESMITNPTPTRAEVSDVANAILDGTDAVMLSAETASGKYPIKVIEMVHKVCISAEKHAHTHPKTMDMHQCLKRKDLAIAKACQLIASSHPIDAIVTLTESGSTAIWISRQENTKPIFAVSDKLETTRLLCLVKNVYPIYFDYSNIDDNEINQHVLECLTQLKLIKPKAVILLARGQKIGQEGLTNRLELIDAL